MAPRREKRRNNECKVNPDCSPEALQGAGLSGPFLHHTGAQIDTHSTHAEAYTLHTQPWYIPSGTQTHTARRTLTYLDAQTQTHTPSCSHACTHTHTVGERTRTITPGSMLSLLQAPCPSSLSPPGLPTSHASTEGRPSCMKTGVQGLLCSLCRAFLLLWQPGC